jgi:hypothetical protein
MDSARTVAASRPAPTLGNESALRPASVTPLLGCLSSVLKAASQLLYVLGSPDNTIHAWTYDDVVLTDKRGRHYPGSASDEYGSGIGFHVSAGHDYLAM